ncbi:DUF4328 domain-containing protein [Kitasatospora sp. NPDC002040]|uniref:DUF4328 domain-containing protein n=1 Tax=Kitasatospora sp. NPDC002040 TaxID=3154661 RepID=UPI00332D6928
MGTTDWTPLIMHSDGTTTAQPPQWQGPPPALAAYRSPRGLAVAASILVGVVALADLLDAAMAFVVRGDYQQLVDEPELSGDLVVNSAVVWAGTSGLTVLALVAAGVVFACWFVRIRKNAELLAPQAPHSRSAGWVVWGWIVPVVSFWFPFQIARDCWRASAPKGDPWGSELVLRLWWAAWLLSLAAGQAAQQLVGAEETPEAYATAFGAVAVADLVDVVAAVLAILVLRRLTALQDATAVRAAAESRPAAAWQWQA